MDIAPGSALYNDALAAARLADERHEPSTRNDYNGSIRRFAQFCEETGYPNPLNHRFRELPSVMAAYINKISEGNRTQWPAEKLRAAMSWHYQKPEMLTGGHPHDKWVVEEDGFGRVVVRGNPAKAPMIAQIMTGLNKVKKRARTPARASPMSLSMLTKMTDFLASDLTFNETMRVWFAAVSSLCFYGMCRINEVLLMRHRDIRVGLVRPHSKIPGRTIEYGCFTIRDRKTDNDPSASRTYNMHKLPRDERAAEALTFVSRWLEYAEKELNHKWSQDDYVFPALTRIPRSDGKKKKSVDSKDAKKVKSVDYSSVRVKWGSPMSDNNFIQVLNVVAGASGISEGILGDEIWFTSHCFRRGGAQYRFMFSPEPRRWSLKMVKWWGGWSPNEQSETLVRYLLGDVMDREENQLGDALAPDMIDQLNQPYLPAADAANHALSTAVPHLELPQQLAMLKEALLDEIQTMLSGIAKPEIEANVGNRQQFQTAVIPDGNVSDLTHITSWKDHWEFYWRCAPAKHQYKPGCDIEGDEKKANKHKLSRMKTIAEFVRNKFNNDIDACEAYLIERLGPALTVNKVCAIIRQQKTPTVASSIHDKAHHR